MLILEIDNNVKCNQDQYYVSSDGNITEDAIKRYIQEQQEESKQEEKSK